MVPRLRAESHAQFDFIRERFWVLFPAFLVSLVLPCAVDAAGNILAVLSWQTMTLDLQRRLYGALRIGQLLRKSNSDLVTEPFDCSSKFGRSTPVYLIASDVASSQEPSQTSSMRQPDKPRATRRVPVTDYIHRFSGKNRSNIFDTHWAIVIRGTTYELRILKEKPGPKVGLRVTSQDSLERLDEWGLPPRLLWAEEIGNTFLLDKEILTQGLLSIPH